MLSIQCHADKVILGYENRPKLTKPFLTNSFESRLIDVVTVTSAVTAYTWNATGWNVITFCAYN